MCGHAKTGPSPNRSVVLDVGACTHARQHKGLSREALSALSLRPHPLSVATIERAETAQPVYLETARRLAELLEVPLSQLLAHDGASVVPLAGEAPAVSVFAFRWLGPTERGRYLADGLTEDLLSRLARGAAHALHRRQSAWRAARPVRAARRQSQQKERRVALRSGNPVPRVPELRSYSSQRFRAAARRARKRTLTTRRPITR